MLAEEMKNKFIQLKLDTMRNEILGFSKSANDCNIIMASHHSEGIGEIIGFMNHGESIKDNRQKREYEGLVEEYNQFMSKLIDCNCKRQ